MIQLESLHWLNVPIVSVDAYGRIIFCNRPATAFLEVENQSVLGREWHAVISTERSAGCCSLCRTRRALRQGEAPHPLDCVVRIAGGRKRVLMVPIPATSEVLAEISFLIIPGRPGERLETPGLVSVLVPPETRRFESARLIIELTERERDTLACIVEGLDARGIATTLGVSHATARNYVQKILTKLGARNKAEAVTVALTHDLLAG
jgi:DNA-binding CsgD family transcriptional regulator